MSEFSKGKWYVDTAGVVRCDDEYDRSIAYLITSTATKDLDDANARLILAAPDMYELLKGFAYPVKYDNIVTAILRFYAKELLARIDGKENNE